MRQRARERAPDAGRLVRKPLELRAAETQDEAVAHGGDGGGSCASCEEGNLADRLIGPDLGDGLAPAFDQHREAARENDVERVGRVALANQHVAALQRECLQLAGKRRALCGIEVGEDADGG